MLLRDFRSDICMSHDIFPLDFFETLLFRGRYVWKNQYMKNGFDS